MCLSKGPQQQQQQQQQIEDPKIAQARIDAEATQKTNAQIADRRRSNRLSMLSTGAAFNSDQSIESGSSSTGKSTFGG